VTSERRMIVGPVLAEAPRRAGTLLRTAAWPQRSKSLRRFVKALSFKAFHLLDRVGVHILPKHYYSPVADYAWLRKNGALWREPASLTGVRWELGEQLAWLEEVTAPFYAEVANTEFYSRLVRSGIGPGFGPIEAQVLYCFIRRFRPARVIEVGGGVSSAVMALAAAANVRDGKPGTEITTIEPSPSAKLIDLPGVRVIPDLCQAVSRDVFDEMRTGDLLFIDSSHSVKTGSEVHRLYLEVIPALPERVVVHVHDVYLPYLYARDVLMNYFDPQETALVLALLTHNDRLAVLCCLSALHHMRSDELGTLLPDYRAQTNDAGLQGGDGPYRHFPSSLWLTSC
jgi:hypothetical protein